MAKIFLKCRKNLRNHSEIIGPWYIMNLRNGKRANSAVQQAANQVRCHSEPVRRLVWESPLVQQAANQLTCHSEPVRRLVWESPSSLRPHSSTREIATPVCALARNDGEFVVWESPSYSRLHSQKPCHSEPVRRLVWESPPSSRPHSPKDGDCHASVRYLIAMTGNSLARNDGEFGCCNPRRTAGAYKTVNT